MPWNERVGKEQQNAKIEKLAFLAQVIEAHTGDQNVKGLAMSRMTHQDAARVKDVRIGMPVEERKEWQCGAEH